MINEWIKTYKLDKVELSIEQTVEYHYAGIVWEAAETFINFLKKQTDKGSLL